MALRSKGSEPLNIKLCALYEKYNRREYIHPDPLEFLYDYPECDDREIVGLIASGLAYGGVKQILRSAAKVLGRTGTPRRFVECSTEREIIDAFGDFKHRFTTGEEMGLLLCGIKRTVEKYGSLKECFRNAYETSNRSIPAALSEFRAELAEAFPGTPRSLLPNPAAGSACKRLHLYLRWMVRQDDVDPGGWDEISPASLLVPVDIHMHRIALHLGFTSRKSADIKTALEITAAFAQIRPDDPVRFDFALTRFGIRDDLDPSEISPTCNFV
jgi:uncharacterized protein (TIGR02757 family)